MICKTKSFCRLVGGPFDGTQQQCIAQRIRVYRLDRHHDLYHVYQREPGRDTLHYAGVIDVIEFRQRWLAGH